MTEELKEQCKFWESEYNNLKNDVQKWKWIIEHKKHILLRLDNDSTHVYFKEDYEEGTYLFDLYLEDFIGWDYGVFALLEAIGIEAEGV